MAILATLNLGLVLFDLSYVPWRDFYLRTTPRLTQVYDSIKGIEPHRETLNYLNVVNALKEQVSQTGLQSPQAEELLAQLRQLSSEMIVTNPFELANKSGTLEKIKNRMRDRMRQTSARTAFASFWSQAYLGKAGWQQEIDFFDRRIRPLIATNYYRQTGENGEFINGFWRIDLPFTILFGLELLARTFSISRRYPSVSWRDAILWRWYDIFLLLPFWRWLRVIPVTIRLHDARLLDLEPARQQIIHSFVASVTEELTEVVVVRVISQIQVSIERGEITRWLFQNHNRPRIDINNVDEMAALTALFSQTIVYQVLPKIQPDIVAILRHNVESALNQSPVYNNLRSLPHFQPWVAQMSEQLAIGITQSIYGALVAAIEDPVGAKLFSQLLQHFSGAFRAQVQKEQTLAEIQVLLVDFLEEVKLNYVKRLAQEDVEQVIEQTRQLRQKALLDSSPTSKQ